jgi:nucleotide-binding universal stress UspA family protein
LFHVVVSYTEMVYLGLRNELALWVGLTEFVVPVLLGNTVGGVVLVTVVNYFETTEERLESARFDGADRRLSLSEWVSGGLVGQSYVPLIDTVEPAETVDNGQYHVVVPITNPRTGSRLVDLACRLASREDDPTVHIVHVVQKPRQSAGGYGVAQSRRVVGKSEASMADLRAIAAEYGVDCDTSTILSHRSFEEIFTAANRKEADPVVTEWGDDGIWKAARADRPLDDLARQLPCDFLVLKTRDLDPSRVLLPTDGNKPSELNVGVARTLRDVAGAEVTLLYVVDRPKHREQGEQFLADWAAEHGLNDAVRSVDDSGDIGAALEREAQGHTLVLLGASERGLLSWLARDALYLDIVDDIGCSVLLAEPKSKKGCSTGSVLFEEVRAVDGLVFPGFGSVERVGEAVAPACGHVLLVDSDRLAPDEFRPDGFPGGDVGVDIEFTGLVFPLVEGQVDDALVV